MTCACYLPSKTSRLQHRPSTSLNFHQRLICFCQLSETSVLNFYYVCDSVLILTDRSAKRQVISFSGWIQDQTRSPECIRLQCPTFQHFFNKISRTLATCFVVWATDNKKQRNVHSRNTKTFSWTSLHITGNQNSKIKNSFSETAILKEKERRWDENLASNIRIEKEEFFNRNKWLSRLSSIDRRIGIILNEKQTCEWRAHSKNVLQKSHKGVLVSIPVAARFFIVAWVIVLVSFGETCGQRIKCLIFCPTFTTTWFLNLHWCRRHSSLAVVSLKFVQNVDFKSLKSSWSEMPVAILSLVVIINLNTWQYFWKLLDIFSSLWQFLSSLTKTECTKLTSWSFQTQPILCRSRRHSLLRTPPHREWFAPETLFLVHARCDSSFSDFSAFNYTLKQFRWCSAFLSFVDLYHQRIISFLCLVLVTRRSLRFIRSYTGTQALTKASFD